MIAVGITQRRESVVANDEHRAELDERWPLLLRECGMFAVPLPNDASIAVEMASWLALPALIVSGGGDLAPYGGEPARDATERALLAWATERDLPVLGVCRGMQLILDSFDQRLTAVTGHVGRRHPLSGPVGGRSVNSFHRLAAVEVEQPLRVTAWTGNVVEAVEHRRARLTGVMWHPEREAPFDPADLALIRRALGTA